jgi:hypothetical protein
MCAGIINANNFGEGFGHGPHFYRILPLIVLWLRIVPIPVTRRRKTPQAFGAMEGHLSSVRPRLQHDRTPSGGSEGFEMAWLAPAQSEEYGESSSRNSLSYLNSIRLQRLASHVSVRRSYDQGLRMNTHDFRRQQIRLSQAKKREDGAWAHLCRAMQLRYAYF